MMRLFYLAILISSYTQAQITSGEIQGKISFHGKSLGNVQIVLSNPTNGTTFNTRSNEMGLYQFAHLIPDKNYRMLFYTTWSDTLLIEPIEVSLGKVQTIHATLHAAVNVLQPVLVKSTISANNSNGGWYLNAKKIAQIPSAGRDYTKLFSLLPQAFIKESANGAISFSGQNNRYNALYIDGALQNDVFGLSANGMYGGQTGNVPVPIEAIDQLQVQVSPYDASLGGYTGAAINMVTKSGKNQPYSSIYRYMRGGQSPYVNTGMTISGPIQLNRIFYFFNIDFIRESAEKKYDFNNYTGDTKNVDQFFQMVNSIKTNYGYDAGSVDTKNQVNALKWAMKLDYKISNKNALIVSMRMQQSDRASTGISSDHHLFFSNNGKFLEHKHFSGSIEWKHQRKRNNSNSLLVSYTQSADQTSPMGKAFPSVSILDGKGLFFLGANEDAMQSDVQQTNITILEKFHFTYKKHRISTGIEIEYNAFKNQFLQNTFGSYFYYSVTDFLLNKKPGDYQINFYTQDQQKPSPFQLLKSAFFVNEQMNILSNVKLQLGIRITAQELLTNPITDSFTSLVAIPIIASYYDLSNAKAGKKPSIPINFSPRLNGFIQIPKQKISIEIGTGLFSGRMPLAWLGGLYYNNGLTYNSFEADQQSLNRIRFQKNIFQQWTPNQLGIKGSRGVLNIAADNLHMPSIWRSSIQLNKRVKQYWVIQAEAMYYLNTQAIQFKNVNLLQPSDQLIGPDKRWVYPIINKGKIPLLPDSSNPFNQVILLSNNDQDNGYGYRWGLQIKQESKIGDISFNYAYGQSFSSYDGNYSVLLNQWRLNEQVNGRNQIGLAISDFSPGHRLNCTFFREWSINKKNKISITLMYNGFSGSRYSYVYGKNNLLRDDEQSPGFDLIYIPTSAELKDQYFIPLVSNEFYFTADQQKEALNFYIDNDPYLKSNRGKYAERNGSSTPFVHRLDGKIATYSTFQLNKRKYGIALSVDIFNMTNLLNSQWGKTYTVPGNRFKLIDFIGFVHPSQLTPIFNFNPMQLTDTPWQEQFSQNPHFSSNWMAQIGCKIIFY